MERTNGPCVLIRFFLWNGITACPIVNCNLSHIGVQYGPFHRAIWLRLRRNVPHVENHDECMWDARFVRPLNTACL